jgi:hypothetical protein
MNTVKYLFPATYLLFCVIKFTEPLHVAMAFLRLYEIIYDTTLFSTIFYELASLKLFDLIKGNCPFEGQISVE